MTSIVIFRQKRQFFLLLKLLKREDSNLREICILLYYF